MDIVELLEHNEIGYEKLIKCLNDNNIATINHATGTGKSFILLKFMVEHSNKKIMFMAPTYPIIDQIINEHPKELGIEKNQLLHIESLIYPNLLKIKNIEEFVKKYDVFILDEYHRCGAKQWGRIINEIKRLIKEKYPEKIIIGTTATEIRYLDDEKNMKDLLFDGVEASRLTLEEAILKGILPVPHYISCDLNSFDKVESIKKRIKNFIIEEKEKEIILEEIENIEKELRKSIFENEDIKKYLKANGKYLVFSSTKENIGKDRKHIERLFHEYNEHCNIKEYVIHSGIEKEKNAQTLDEFRKAKKNNEAHILYSIKILSEGVHVKGIDAEFQCARTTSPILYFQLIGRLLSYSQRKEKVVIFDLVNNLQNHRAIYELYSRLVKRAKELSETNPENKEKYEEIINKLKIVDKSSEIYKKIDELNNKYSKEKLIENILEKNISNLEKSPIANYIELYKTEVTIKKYYKYINIDMFKRIKKLKILQDQKLFQMTEQDFEKLLKGYSTLYDLLNNKYKISYKKIKNFLSKNYRIPSLFSNDKDEKNLAIELCNNFDKYSKSQKQNIKTYLNEDDTCYERMLYIKTTKDIDVEQLKVEIEYIMNLDLAINKNIIYYLKNRKVDNEYIEQIEKYNEEKIKKILEESLKEEQIDLIKVSNYETSRQTSEIIEKLIEKAKTEQIEKILEDSYKKIKEYIKKYKELPEYWNNRLKDTDKKIESTELYLLNKILSKLFNIYGYTEKINSVIIETKEIEKDNVLNNLVEFMKKNNYNLPSIKSSDKEEISLAIAYNRIKGKLTPIQQEKIKEYLKKHDENKDIIVEKLTKFIINNIGKPATFTKEDIELLRIYNKYKTNLSTQDLNKIERSRKISEIFYFIINNNYEIPNIKNEEPKEQELARYYNMIKNTLTEEEKQVFEQLTENIKIAKTIFIQKYKEFIKNNKRLPLLIKPEEKSLVYSYNRWIPYLTQKEKEEIKLKEIGKYQAMKNAYEALKGMKK